MFSIRMRIAVACVTVTVVSGYFIDTVYADRSDIGVDSGAGSLEWVAENIMNMMSAGVIGEPKNSLLTASAEDALSDAGGMRQLLIRASSGLHRFFDVLKLGFNELALRLKRFTIVIYDNLRRSFRNEEAVVEVQDGVIVFPASGSRSLDEATIAKLAETFSDEIIVLPGSAESPGVIKPVFKDSIGEDYLYLVVPLDR